MNHSSEAPAENSLDSYQKKLRSEVYEPHESFRGVDDDDDDPTLARFESPRDCKEILLLDFQNQDQHSEFISDDGNENDADILDLSKRESFNSSIPMTQPQRQESGEIPSLFQKYCSTLISTSTIGSRENGNENSSSSEESLVGSYYFDHEDDLDRSKREKFNSSIPMTIPQRQKSRELSRSDYEGENLHGTSYDSDSEESLLDDLELSKREKFNSSFPMMKPRRQNSGELFPYYQKEESTSGINKNKASSEESENSLSDLEETSDGDLEIIISKREKMNSSIPMLKPQRKKSGDLLPYFRKQRPASKEDEDCFSDSSEESSYHGTHDDGLAANTRIKKERYR